MIVPSCQVERTDSLTDPPPSSAIIRWSTPRHPDAPGAIARHPFLTASNLRDYIADGVSLLYLGSSIGTITSIQGRKRQGVRSQISGGFDGDAGSRRRN